MLRQVCLGAHIFEQLVEYHQAPKIYLKRKIRLFHFENSFGNERSNCTSGLLCKTTTRGPKNFAWSIICGEPLVLESVQIGGEEDISYIEENFKFFVGEEDA